MRKIHRTAVVSRKAELGKDVQIGPFAVIDDNVTLGDGCIIGPHAYITGYTTLGKENQVYHGTVIGSRPQDLKFQGEKTFLKIGDRNHIREFATMNPGTGEGNSTVIGNDNLFMAYSHIAHDCQVGSHCILVNCGSLAGHCICEDHVVLGGLSAAHQFVHIGKMSIIGGLSKVVQDIPPFSTCDGHPARIYGLNRIGLRRSNCPLPVIKELDAAFNTLFNSGIPAKKAMEKLLRENKKPCEEVMYLINFIKSSSRGITRSCRAVKGNEE